MSPRRCRLVLPLKPRRWTADYMVLMGWLAGRVNAGPKFTAAVASFIREHGFCMEYDR
jgi:hypothetical protein